jgi:hypothetical protein
MRFDLGKRAIVDALPNAAISQPSAKAALLI